MDFDDNTPITLQLTRAEAIRIVCAVKGWTAFVDAAEAAGAPEDSDSIYSSDLKPSMAELADTVGNQLKEHAVTRNNALSNTCDHCGNTFTRVTAQQRFCSTKCRVYYHRQQVA